jgi:ribonucleotide monophosphatase NagD (HAD superfamily)
MVGDDIEADIAGALGAGLAAVQVRTGKYTGADNTREDVRPTARIGSIAGLPDWLGL